MDKQLKDIKKKLEESEIKYRRLFESAYDGILILDSETGQVTDVNPFLEMLLGYSKEEFLEKKLWELGAFKNMKAARDAFKTLQKEGYVRYEDLPLETKSGNFVDVEFVSNSYLAGGKLVIQCNIRDITERKKIDSIKNAKKLLEEERLRVESIANTAHELRTPIAIIKGNIDISLGKKTGKAQRSPQATLRLINREVLNLSKILSDIGLITEKAWDVRKTIFYEKVNLQLLIKKVVARCRVIAGKKHITVITTGVQNISILGDKRYLEKMMINLIENSVIYGVKNGQTTISVKKSNMFVRIEVTDDGVGISQKDLPHIFERFYRGDKSHSGVGVGLGLSIVKWAVDLHGGSISVEKQKKGSIFSIILPTQAAATK